jgi:hypothetical protein
MKMDANGVLLAQGPNGLRNVIDRGARQVVSEIQPAGAKVRTIAKRTRDRTKPLQFTLFKDFGHYARKEWIQKGILARGEISSWIGPPGSGKSALLAEISFHVASGRNWRGHRSKGPYAVVIFALERADLYCRRFEVYKTQAEPDDDSIKDLPIAVVGDAIDAMSSTVADKIVSTVKAVEEATGTPVGLIVIDTYPKAIAVGGGDEDRAKDQNRAAANLRKIQEELDVHIALVGHTGKQEHRGARGSNAHLGDVDVMIQIAEAGGVKVAKITKGNDTSKRELASYSLQVVALACDEDGEPVTTTIVSSSPAQAMATRRSTKAQAALQAIHECIAEGACAAPRNEYIPEEAKCITLKRWRDRLATKGIINPEGNPSEEFKRIRVRLENDRLIGTWGHFVWLLTRAHITSQFKV